MLGFGLEELGGEACFVEGIKNVVEAILIQYIQDQNGLGKQSIKCKCLAISGKVLLDAQAWVLAGLLNDCVTFSKTCLSTLLPPNLKKIGTVVVITLCVCVSCPVTSNFLRPH